MTVHEVMMEYLRGLQGEKPKAPVKDPRRSSALLGALRAEGPKDKQGVPYMKPTVTPYVS